MVARFSVSVDRGVAVPMRDGTVLYADIYRPSGPGRYPVILTRTAYDRTATPPSFGIRAAGEGYVLVSQDIRGRYESEGSFHAFPNEANDGYDTCAWICEQPWSNGRIGTFGGSYVGLTQWQAALAGAPGLQAMVPNVTAADYHEGWCYQGGAFELSFIKSWTLTWLATDTARRLAASDPAYQAKLETLWDRCDAMEADFDIMPLAGDPLLAELAPYYDEWLAHPDHGPFWDQYKIDGNYGRLDQAVLHAGGWYDVFLGGTLHNYMGMRAGAKTEAARKAQRLLIGPWDHMTIATQTPVGEYDPGVRSWYGTIDFDGIQLRFYDRYLRDLDNGARGGAAGPDLHDGREPLAPRKRVAAGTDRVHRLLFPLGRLGEHAEWRWRALPRGAVGRKPAGPLHLRPAQPGPEHGRRALLQRGEDERRAVRPAIGRGAAGRACYTSAPLEQPIEVTGPVTVTLYASSSAVDTDFTAKLVDVCPCGCVVNLTDGIIRARYRNGTGQQELMTPGEVSGSRSIAGRRATCSGRGIRFGSRSRRATSRASIATRTRAG